MKQIANVAALPGIVGYSVGLPDVHAGYGFAIGKLIISSLTYDPRSCLVKGHRSENFMCPLQ